METLVAGTIRTSTGDPPDFYVHSDGQLVVGNSRIDFRSTILGGHALVVFSSRGENLIGSNDEIFRLARHTLENLLFAEVLRTGTGLQYTLEHCRTADGKIVRAIPDNAGVTASTDISYQSVTVAMGVDPLLRYALRDFNGGLIDRESSPVYFYRAVETIARIVSKNHEENLTTRDWETVHSALGTSKQMIDPVLRFSKPHRHGNHDEFSGDQHLEMMRATREVIARFLAWRGPQEAG